jgi:hypothetical protein
MANNFWTPLEDSFLRRNAYKMDAGELAKHINRTPGAIAARASLLNIKIRSMAEARRASTYHDAAFDEYEQAQKQQVRTACEEHLADLQAAYVCPFVPRAAAIVEG